MSLWLKLISSCRSSWLLLPLLLACLVCLVCLECLIWPGLAWPVVCHGYIGFDWQTVFALENGIRYELQSKSVCLPRLSVRLLVCLSVTLLVCLSVCFSCCCCCCCHLIANFNEIFQRFSRCLCLQFYCNACFSSCCKESPPSIDWAFCVWAAIRRMSERKRERGKRE